MSDPGTDPRRRRILIVEDHPIVRRGFASLINHEPDLVVCGEADSVRDALDGVQALQPDLVLVDIFLKESNGLDFIKALRDRRDDLPVLVVSMHDETLYAERAIRAGAMGYVMKDVAEQTIVEAIRRVLRGSIYLSQGMQERVLLTLTGRRPSTGQSPLESLTDREIEIFEMLGHGQTVRTIAEELHLSVKTVDAHRARIKEKLNLQSSNDVLRHAVHWIQSGNRNPS